MGAPSPSRSAASTCGITRINWCSAQGGNSIRLVALLLSTSSITNPRPSGKTWREKRSTRQSREGSSIRADARSCSVRSRSHFDADDVRNVASARLVARYDDPRHAFAQIERMTVSRFEGDRYLLPAKVGEDLAERDNYLVAVAAADHDVFAQDVILACRIDNDDRFIQQIDERDPDVTLLHETRSPGEIGDVLLG